MNYKPLEPEFVKTGFRFKQLVREGDIAIFHKVALQPKPRDAGFEVVVIQQHDEHERAPGVIIEAKEALPSPEQWGTKGWTYRDLFSAEQRYARLQGKEIALEDDGERLEDDSETPPVETEPKRQRRPRGSCPTDLNIPEGEFSIQEMADFNEGAEYNDAAVFIRKNPDKVKPSGNQRPNARGRGKKITLYVKVA